MMLGNSSGAMVFILFVAIFLGALLIFEGLRQLLSRKEDAATSRNRRMKMLANGAKHADVLDLFLDERRRSSANFSLLAKLSRLLRQAGYQVSPVRFLFGQAIVSTLIFIAVSRVLPLPAAASLSSVIAYVLPVGVLMRQRATRTAALTAQLPDALDLMARGLMVGHPINVTVGAVAKEMADPIGSEFGIVLDQVSYGDDLIDAISDLAARYEIEDLNYFAVSVAIQHGTGGNLARVLKVLSKVIRDRATMHKKIHAISAEGRLSAMILSFLPFAIVGIISLTTPSFYGDVSGDPMFLPFATAILALILLQAAILFRLVNFKF